MKSKNQIRILIVDDHLVVRMGLVSLFSFETDFKVVGETDNGEDAIRLVDETHPDFIVMDLLLPKLNGAETSRQILARHPEVKIMILTPYDTAHELHSAIDAGVSGAVLKTSNHEDLIKSIRRILDGERVISPEIAHTLSSTEGSIKLTSRQTEILELTARGYSNEDIAKALSISINSVKDHLKQIFIKLNVSSRAEATTQAIKHRLICVA